MSKISEPYEELALPEPSLLELYGQLAQMLRSLERRVQVWDANAVALEKNFAQFEPFLAQNEPDHGDLQESPSTLPQSLLMSSALMEPVIPQAQPRRAAQPAAPVYMAKPLGQVKRR